MSDRALAIDFGTSNSAVAINVNHRPVRLPIEDKQDTLPTAVFFPTRGSTMQIGRAAAEAMIAGHEGRYMRSLKSVLGAPILHEPRMLGGKRMTLADVVTEFLIEVKKRAETASDQRFERVISGRPVHFHSLDPGRDRQAEIDLKTCYHSAGFKDVAFMYEPEAAALASHSARLRGRMGLIVDIGGGTSDFTVFQSDGDRQNILASHGVRLGGENFDHVLSMTHVMPLLGMGGQLKRVFGQGLQPTPKAIFSDLSTWAKIPFLYSHETRRNVDEMIRLAVEPGPLDRLAHVLQAELGHQLAFAVERGKIDANSGQADASIAMGLIERGLNAPISETSLNEAVSGFQVDLKAAAAETLNLAGVEAEAIEIVVFVGGSSLMRMVSSAIAALCPGADFEHSDAFTAIVDGLALASPQSFY